MLLSLSDIDFKHLITLYLLQIWVAIFTSALIPVKPQEPVSDQDSTAKAVDELKDWFNTEYPLRQKSILEEKGCHKSTSLL